MALTFPLATDVFQDVINVAAAPFRLRENQEYSGLGSGQVYGAELSAPLWTTDVRLFSAFADDAVEIQALIESLNGVLKTFYFYDPRTSHPKADPDGSILGAATPIISSVHPSNHAMRLSGLPVGYTLTRGDMLAFNYADPARRALHQLNETVTASSSGVTPLFDVRPHFRPGVEAGLDVMLIKPAAKMLIVPGTLQIGVTDDFGTTAISFTALQSIRAN
ncbi:hypothetical protein [Chelativorans sp. YIM 93263]|uniref:hypothetical protein n=1 Tax=Chelativorans sp. YIM 93263 TaxID=2906648 RepID=UPI002378A4A4|nr:hypothetical protein [Chelativorans sp. YIM 93263]